MIRSFLCVCVLSLCAAASGYGRAPDAAKRALRIPAPPRDTVVMKDTLVESSFRIEHKPLRAGGAVTYGWSTLQSKNIPAPLALAGCDYYGPGTGRPLSLGAIAEIPLWGDVSRWTLEPRLYFAVHPTEYTWVRVDSGRAGSAIVPVSTRHELSGTVDEIAVAGVMNYRLAPWFALRGGVSLGYQFRQHYETSEHLIEPGHSFASGARDTTTGSGSLPDGYRLAPGLIAGAGFEIPLSAKLRVQPSYEFQMPLRGLTPYWSGFSNVLALRFFYDLTPRYETVPVYVRKQIEVVEHVPEQETQPQRPALSASIEAYAVDRAGEKSKVVGMRVEEIRTRSAYPILNYVFFDEGSAVLPSRYVQYRTAAETAKFEGSHERSNIRLLDLYLEDLNILGDRLAREPRAKLTLIGSTSNTGTEEGNLALAQARANAVKDYLVKIWKIEPTRIRTEATLLPRTPSPTTTEAGQQENRRVEFVVSDDRVLDPIVVSNIEHFATPDKIRLVPTVSHPIASYAASIHANGVELQSFKGDNTGSSWKTWAPSEETLSRLKDSLLIDYTATDSAGNVAHAHSSIPLQITRVTTNREEKVERFSLILFGFDESHVGARNEREIEKVAKLLPTMQIDRVLVQGYTDETGEAAHNDELSEKRATEVRKKLEQLLHSEGASLPKKVITEGRGSRDLLYDNSLPEGRFFSRTVNITVERATK